VVDQVRERGGTVVVATHDLGDAERADHVMLLAGGVVAAGSPDEVITAEHLRRAYGGRSVRDGSVGAMAHVDEHVHSGGIGHGDVRGVARHRQP
jgi:ABC-type cobalamin/Fe3+-siderophores transport system ATPase subunit